MGIILPSQFSELKLLNHDSHSFSTKFFCEENQSAGIL
jgi:hypothetical protein